MRTALPPSSWPRGDYQYVEPDWICYPIDTIPNDPQYGSQWQHPKMQCPKAWDLYTGDSTRIAAFVDTGVDTDHADLKDHLIPGYNAVDRLTQAQGGQVEDINGHGTAVSGCIGAIGNNGTGVAGVNWTIKLLPVRASNSSGGGAYMTDLTHGALWAAQNGAKTISVSYSGVSSSSVGTTGTQIKALDALLIWAAGNDGSQLSGFDWADVIVAGATDTSDNPASFTNYGTPIDVMAPGVSVHTTKNGGTYASVSGTSFSAPLTNGVAALIWGYNPGSTANEVETALFDGCDDLGNPSLFGHGRVNAYEGLMLAVPPLSIKFPDGVPSGVYYPGPETPVTLEIVNGTENYVAGSGKLYYRFDSGSAYSQAGFTALGGGLYEAVIPNTRPGDEVEFYFSALGSGGTTIMAPADAPATVFGFDARFETMVFEDDFETNKGWTVTNVSLTDGAWERGTPLGGGDRGDPPTDHDGSGKCFLTDNEDGNSGRGRRADHPHLPDPESGRLRPDGELLPLAHLGRRR